jgi:putative addiction module killer protein
VGEGVMEFRLDFGPGYRVYFGHAGDTLVILLCGGGGQANPIAGHRDSETVLAIL